MSATITLVADLLVAILLVATISSSIVLSRRITRLKADESTMRRTTEELMRASESAERAIAGLRSTLGDCDRTLAERLRTAERYAADLAAQVEAGTNVMTRISRVVQSSRKLTALREEGAAEPPPPRPGDGPNVVSLDATAAAAQALAERAKRRAERRAA